MDMCSSALTERESRLFARHVVRGEAKIEPLDEEAHLPLTLQVIVADISRCGVMLQIDRMVVAGSMWRLRFTESGHTLGTASILVRYCRPVGKRSYEVGGQYIIEPYILKTLGVSWHDLKQESTADPEVRSQSSDQPDSPARKVSIARGARISSDL